MQRQEKRVLTNHNSLVDPGHLVDVDVAGDVRVARQETGVVSSRRLEAAADGPQVAILANLQGGADGQAGRVGRQAHRPGEVAKVGVDLVTLGSDQDELAGLVGRHDQRNAQPLQQRRERRRMLAP